MFKTDDRVAQPNYYPASRDDRARYGRVVEVSQDQARVRVFWYHPNGMPDKRTWVAAKFLVQDLKHAPQPLRPTGKTISGWIEDNIGSHDIADHEKLVKTFETEVGLKAVWPCHTLKKTIQAIKARGLGGSIQRGPDNQLCCYGWQVAQGLAYEYANEFRSGALGRGTAYYDCLAALKNVGK